jgi:flagellar biosynthetic protein FlhB
MADEQGGEKTEEPTSRRLQEARKRGDVPKSRDLSSAVALAAMFTVLAMGGIEAGMGRLIGYFSSVFSGAVQASQTGTGWVGALGQGAREAGMALGIPLGVACVAALGAGLLQTRGLFTLEALRLDPTRAAPKLSRVVSQEALGEVVKGLVKVVLVGIILWATLSPLLRPLAFLTGASAAGILGAMGVFVEVLGQRLVLAAAVLGVADFMWQRHRNQRSLRMTREEVKREHKQSEGDPHHKAERQRLHRQISEQRMLADVRKADFVVVNPEHIAVALRYDQNTQQAPVVVAKGEHLLAERIKEIAREAGVPIFREVALARALSDLEEGDEIPEALYEAVAELCRVIYRDKPGGGP